MTSRLGNDITVAYPELAGMADAVEDALLDGEVVVFDKDGRPSFGALQERMHVRVAAQARRLARVAPVTFLAFDLLRLYGVDLRARPYAERRATLERLELAGSRWATPPVFDDGEATVEAARQHGLEGVVAKRLAATYRSGARSSDWVKVKFTKEQEFVVGGWQWGEGERAGAIGSLLLGYYDRGDLYYAGQVGSGFRAQTLRDLMRQLAPLQRDTSPYAHELPPEHQKNVVWCEPKMVIQAAFSAWTGEGRLRHATYQGLRNDKDPREVHRE